jgi:molecular chaperone GrpE (heat shock protein)
MKRLFGRPPIPAISPNAGGPAGPPPEVIAQPPLKPIDGEAIGLESKRIPVTDILDVATNAWRARGKMLDPQSGQVREEMKRVIRHIDAILTRLTTMGFELKDHTGDGFDYGQALRVVGTEPREGLAREEVLETMKPTIYWNGRLLQTGEVVVGTPLQGKDV